MKKNKLYIGAGLLMLGAPLASCSSDYLEQPPLTSISDDMVGTSVEAARAALYGTCQAMYIGTYVDRNDRNNSGEGWFQTYYGDAGSPDFWDSWLWGYQSDFQNWSLMTRDNVYASVNGWMYGYNIINQANMILDRIDNIQGDDENRDFIKAQCLTMRAHGYVRMMQVYAPRYEDRNNGQELCLVLREHAGTEPLPLSTYDECIKFIYDDLDKAIELYNGTPVERRFGYEPDLSVAQGIYSRIALLNHDWQKAADMAKAARAGYPIMTAEEFKQGFAEPTSEWLWYNDYQEITLIGYNSWGASYSCNGAYSTAYEWAGAGNISMRLYDQIYSRHNDDVRCDLFWTPDKANKYVDLDIPASDFWSTSCVNSEYGFMYGRTSNEKMTAAISLFVRHNTPEGEWGTMPYGVDISLSDDDAKSALRRRRWFSGLSKDVISSVQFGAQIKFLSYDSKLGGACHPFLRASELLLTQAEAEYELQNEPEARNLLIELNSNRVSNYTCELSGTALRDEIRLYRRMELWGEGDCWFSFKRWNLPVERVAWKEGDMTSDTFLIAYEGRWEPSYGKGWRYLVPTSEKNYSPIVTDQINSANNK